jgi:hypothetical protein
MTPKLKAEHLFNDFYELDCEVSYGLEWAQAKKCALITVDNIIKSHTYGLSKELKQYWKEVKKEINRL